MAITLTIVEKVKGKADAYKRTLKIYRSIDKARKDIIPIVKEMRVAKKLHTEPQIRIDGVSYETDSEKALLLETGAIVSIDNE